MYTDNTAVAKCNEAPISWTVWSSFSEYAVGKPQLFTILQLLKYGVVCILISIPVTKVTESLEQVLDSADVCVMHIRLCFLN